VHPKVHVFSDPLSDHVLPSPEALLILLRFRLHAVELKDPALVAEHGLVDHVFKGEFAEHSIQLAEERIVHHLLAVSILGSLQAPNVNSLIYIFNKLYELHQAGSLVQPILNKVTDRF
jgi:hypothetical protein